MSAAKKIVIYHHGKDSTPWGEKTVAFAEVTKNLEYEFLSPDYRGQLNPDKRVEQFLTNDFSGYEKIIQIGSSMGAYVATLAAEILPCQGLFLLAPAFYLPGYQHRDFNPPPNTLVFHGWRDDIVPPENSWNFCHQHKAGLFLLDSDHRLLDQLPLLTAEFSRFLALTG